MSHNMVYFKSASVWKVQDFIPRVSSFIDSLSFHSGNHLLSYISLCQTKDIEDKLLLYIYISFREQESVNVSFVSCSYNLLYH
ncbi:unnamed protein product [Heterobilharzia americana]|nr:unnamed protein product [Heterobilharzia americana]